MNSAGRLAFRLTLALCLLTGLAPFAVADAPWETQVEQEGLVVETRDVAGSKYKAFRAEITVAATMEAVLARLRDVESYVSWFPDTLEARRLEAEGERWRQYVRTDAPWPVKDRDAIYEQSLDWSETLIRINVIAVPDGLPEVDDAVRVREAQGFWELRALDSGATRVHWEFHLEPGGRIPSSLANARVVETPKKVLLALRAYFQPAEE